MFCSFPATLPSHTLTLTSTIKIAKHSCLAKHLNTHLTQVSSTVSFQGYKRMFNHNLLHGEGQRCVLATITQTTMYLLHLHARQTAVSSYSFSLKAN